MHPVCLQKMLPPELISVLLQAHADKTDHDEVVAETGAKPMKRNAPSGLEGI